jgi:Phytanoyl-CoA dioxygenase (PhyH)
VSSSDTDPVRPVTAAELTAFKEEGWTVLRSLVDPAYAATLLGLAQQRLGENAGVPRRPGIDLELSFYHDYKDIGRREEPLFLSVATNRTLGHNSARLLGRDSSIRLITESLAVKLPRGSREAEMGASATEWHQDWPGRGVDRTTLNLWLALDDLPPESGVLRFYRYSNRLGSLGSTAVTAGNRGGRDLKYSERRVRDSRPLPEKYPYLAELPVSDPLHLRPGDATVHNAFVVHGAPENLSDRPRWSYIVVLYPGDAIYNGYTSYLFANTGLQCGDEIDCDEFPEIYTPAVEGLSSTGRG